MTKNPYINALAAFAYIAIISFVMFFANRGPDSKLSFLAPIAALSVFTFSAAIMAYIFFYHPFQMYFDGKKKAAIDLFFKTVATFGGITILIIILMYLRLLS